MNSNGGPVALFKQISCDVLDLINQEIMSYINRREFTQEQFWNTVNTAEIMQVAPLFRTWLIDHDLPVKTVAITRGLNPHCCGPHTDTPPSVIKLSWPVMNTQLTWNRWLRPTPDAPTEINALGGTSYLDPSTLIEIGRMRVDQPAIIATGIPHDVWFEPGAEFPRWGLQCQLFKEPQL